MFAWYGSRSVASGTAIERNSKSRRSLLFQFCEGILAPWRDLCAPGRFKKLKNVP
jgi:hypothetical protein